MKSRMLVRSSSVFLTGILLATPAPAEDLAPRRPSPGWGAALVAGARVRVTAAVPGRFTGVTVGRLVKFGAEDLTLIDSEAGTVLELPISSVTRLEVSHGRRRHGRLGLLIGAAVGIPLGLAAISDSAGGCGFTYYAPCTTADKVWSAGLSGALFGGLGVLIGHKVVTERWSDAPVDRLRVTVRPERGGGRVAIAFSF